MDASTERALAALVYGIEARKGIITLIGSEGADRSAVLEQAAHSLGEGTAVVAVSAPVASFDEMLEWICRGFGISVDEPGRLRRLVALNDFLLAKLTENRNVAIVVDGAELLGDGVLEDLRLLANLETGKEKILQIVLAGGEGLDEKLAHHGLRQLRQRVGLRVALESADVETEPSANARWIGREIDRGIARLRALVDVPSLRYGCALAVFAFGVPLTWALVGDLRMALEETVPVTEALRQAGDQLSPHRSIRSRALVTRLVDGNASENDAGGLVVTGVANAEAADIAAPTFAEAGYPITDTYGKLLIGVGGVCGNGVVEIGEQCDDGNVIETDGCVGLCRVARCGDRLVQVGVEDCDQGAANSDALSAACSSTCRAPR